MKVAIVGGGPSGLYLGMLLKKGAPNWRVEVVEQNPSDATFGFGVVVADTGLMQLKQADDESYEELVGATAQHDRQVIVQDETPIEICLPIKGGAIPRLTLLQILEKHALKAGVTIHHNQRIESIDDLARWGLDDADVVVGADGINSVIREQFSKEFGTTYSTLSNHFAWYGTKKVFETSALVFRKYKGGYFCAHYYPYSESMSTFVAECDDKTWTSLAMDQMTNEERTHLFEKIYENELEGHELDPGPASKIWRQFPVIRSKHWVHGRYVLVGDALASAHFSIGSGTRIAMNDSIALAQDLLGSNDGIEAALEAYEKRHKPIKQKLIAASEKSYLWYENMSEWMDKYSPKEFVYRFMTRTGRVDDERLMSEFPDLAEKLEIGEQ
ncbi:FAD-dependent monooxygenase [Marinobacter salarius]|uniref:FAD-dependent monooxygenase n=1 Tax=Marinobacter salarius TaxID=1420917 RepID=UPI001D189E05|nr:FAD-dependent monooxygenase [Marinobacter salarius]MCC4284848.1 FAD-dependent monooxygenase [Marinobacter salarius]